MSFKLLSMCTAIVALLLCLLLLVYPDVLLFLFGIKSDSAGYFIGRRAAMLFLGLSVLTWCSRNLSHSEARQAICLSIVASMVGLAGLGGVEYFRGEAGSGIFLAIVTEMTFAILYLKIWLKDKGIL